MYLYRLGEYISAGTTPTLPIVSFENSIDISRVPTYPMDEMERLWKEEKQITFVLHYLEGNDVYYFLLPTDHPDTTDYWHHELIHQNLKWHHCDFYSNRILERFLDRFTRRLHTRTVLSKIHLQIQHELNITDENEPHFQEALYETLCTIHLDDSHDRHLIQRVRDEVHEKVETERRYRPDGEGFLEAQHDFKEKISQSSSL
jgi:hypothetical protein